MKVKFKECISRVTTINSPYRDEIGTHSYKYISTYCGKCDHNIEQAYFYKNWNYCPHCGEKIEWLKKPGEE